MEDSILNNTKKTLGLAESYSAFDHDVIIQINSAFGVLTQIGIIPPSGFAIEDKEAKWADLNLPTDQLSLVKNYIFLKSRLGFDPPNTSFLIKNIQDQIAEYEVRLNTMREYALAEEVSP